MGRDAGLGHQIFQQVAGFVVADDGQERGMCTQAHHVVGHVGTAAQTVFFAGDAHHRHGGFGADAVDRTIPIAVEHHIAHDQDMGLAELLWGDWGALGHSSSTRRAG